MFGPAEGAAEGFSVSWNKGAVPKTRGTHKLPLLAYFLCSHTRSVSEKANQAVKKPVLQCSRRKPKDVKVTNVAGGITNYGRALRKRGGQSYAAIRCYRVDPGAGAEVAEQIIEFAGRLPIRVGNPE
jgi:hypothetical protein